MQNAEHFGAACLALCAAASSYVLNDLSLALFGLPITAIGMAAAGSVMSYAFGTSERSRKKLFFVALASTFFGASMVTVVPDVFGWDIKPVAQPPLAFMFAIFARWIIPALKNALPAMAAAAASMFNRGGNYGGGYGGPQDMPPYDPRDDKDRRDPPSGGY